MRAVHKYTLRLEDGAQARVGTYKGVKWLHAETQNDRVTVWAEVKTDANPCWRMLHVVGTGHRIPPDAVTYIGTCMLHDGAFVFHVYAEKEPIR